MIQPPSAFGTYDFPSRDRIELFGDDQLVNVFWEGNIFIVAPGCFRVPRTMPWSELYENVIVPWASADPDFDSAKVSNWRIDDEPFEPKPDDTLESLGVVHKGLLKFNCA